jgi:DNA primase
MRFDDSFLDEIRAATDIVELISPYVKLKKKGKNWFGLCPFHNEKTPSFSVNRERAMYYCFGCGAGGNAITFLVEHDGMSFPQAVEELARRTGIPLPKRRVDAGAEKRDELRAALEAAATFFQGRLKETSGKEAVSYLKARGITGATAKAFRLGFAPGGWDELQRHLESRGFSAGVMEQAGLVKPREGGGHYDTFRNRLIFPFMDRRGRITGFGARLLSDEEEGPKYLNSPETPIFRKGEVLYGLAQAVDALLKEERALLVEGYFDVLSLYQSGIRGVVAASGTAFTDRQALILKRLVKRVLLLFDADPAGLKAALRSYASLAREGLDVSFLTMPAGEDPDTLLHSEGVEAFRSRLRHAKPVVQFYLEQLDPPMDERGVGERAEAARGLLDLLRHDSDELRRAMSLQQLSARIGLDEETLKREMESLARQDAVYEVARNGEAPTAIKGPAGSLDTELLRLVVNSDESRTELLSFLDADDFHDTRCRDLFLRFAELQEKGSFGVDKVLEQSDADSRNMLASLLAEESPDFEGEVSVTQEELLKRVEARRLKERRRRLKASMEQARRAGDDETLDRLLKKYQEMHL